MSKKNKLRKGQARMEYIACQSRIKELRAEGCDIIMTYCKLVEEGLITMSYGGFYDLVTQRKRRKKNPDKFTALPNPTPLFPPAPAIQPALPPKLIAEIDDQQSISIVTQKTQPLLPEQQKDQSLAVTEQHRKAMSLQEKLDKNIRANKDHCLNSVNSDPDLKKELDRLRGKE